MVGLGTIWLEFGHLAPVMAMISDALFALLATGGCVALVVLGLLIQKLEPARLRTWREQREAKRRAIAEIERQQEEQLDRVRDTTGAGHDDAILRYLELENSIEIAKRT
jgi:predicted lysophospholipase L1 biosynthesis ABC-type transport system permease subunit